MTRADAIERWTIITRVVFRAEDKIADDWHDRLTEATKQSKEVQSVVAEEYCEAVAHEIVDRMTDKELARIK
ncbi:MAG: hypothetical protein IKM58_00295 [Tidjanibacter sp.]|nr:hypothetical protein [Prevotella sp.]MBR6830512.1 hypothetical protein [Tidjanibacter sp.]